MAETQPTWVSCNDPTCYTPQDMRLNDARLVCGEGVVMSTGTELQVTQNIADPLCVDVAAGGAWINADLGGDCQGVYGVHNCGVETVCAEDGDPTDPRIDRVVFRVMDSDFGGTECGAVIEIITGAPSPAPIPPPTPDNAIALASLTVTAAGITEITDRRRPFVACGASRMPETVLESNVGGASGSFSKVDYPDASWFEVLIAGAGGGGGGCSAQGSGLATVGGGGAGGAGIRLRVAYDDMPTGLVGWSVGAGGAGGGGGGGQNGPGQPGVAGGATDFGDWTAGGGSGGEGSPAGSAQPNATSVAAGGTVVTGSFGELIVPAVPGDPSDAGVRLSATQFSPGGGGDGPYGIGVGGFPHSVALDGEPGLGAGAGGSGAAAANSSGFLGGDGAAGFVQVIAHY